jgi:NADPH:quinone reductase-like Zn-dependent oxidoreductase
LAAVVPDAAQIPSGLDRIKKSWPTRGEVIMRVRAMGSDLTINYRQHDDWGVRARDWTGGRGVDHVIEVGGPGTLAQSIAAVRVGGHISLIGVLTGLGGEVPTAALMAKQARLQGLIVGNRRHQVERCERSTLPAYGP